MNHQADTADQKDNSPRELRRVLNHWDAVALIDAHQPAYVEIDGERVFHLQSSIENVVATSLRALGVPRVIVRDLLERRREEAGAA